MSKNYCSEHEVKQNITKKVTCHEKMRAFLDYLRRPKTVFDLKVIAGISARRKRKSNY